jgi:hypothetical protein
LTTKSHRRPGKSLDKINVFKITFKFSNASFPTLLFILVERKIKKKVVNCYLFCPQANAQHPAGVQQTAADPPTPPGTPQVN